MKRWLKWLVPVLALVLIGGFVARTMKARKAEAAAIAQKPAAPSAIELAAADVVSVSTRELTRTLAISGGLRAVDSAFVKAKVAAELKTLTVREGDAVKAGQRIGQLDTTELDWRVKQAEQNAASMRTQLDIAKRALDNNRALVAQGFISPTGLETSVSTEAGARASFESTQTAVQLARKSLADATLLAPINGIVSQRLAQPGERVAIDAKVVEVVDLSRIELEAALAPEDIVGVQIGQAAALTVDGFAGPASARVVRLAPSAQAGSRAVMVYLAVQPQPGLRQGLFARGNIELQRGQSLVVPVSTVRVDQAKPYVLAVIDGKVAQRIVTLGARGEARFATTNGAPADAAVEVTSGLAPGMLLLRNTVGVLRDGTPVKLPGSGAAVASSSAASAP